jgi:hypothetical protein
MMGYWRWVSNGLSKPVIWIRGTQSYIKLQILGFILLIVSPLVLASLVGPWGLLGIIPPCLLTSYGWYLEDTAEVLREKPQ